MTSKKEIEGWFYILRDKIRDKFQSLEKIYANSKNIPIPEFKIKKWERPGGGGGEMSLLHGNVFEKLGVNISTVFGEFDKNFAKEITGTSESSKFFATGISVVAHMCSPLVPAVHFNIRYIETANKWFGGGADLTPTYIDEEESLIFHRSFKEVCDKYNEDYYTEFSKKCDEYFFLKHRNEARGIGGIFFDYLNSGSMDTDFNFVKAVGLAFLHIYPEIVIKKMNLIWSDEQKNYQLIKRGRYVEFNLLYDRGTKFGLMTGGNIEAILMSLPPLVKWS